MTSFNIKTVVWMLTTLWKFRLRCSSLHSVIRPKGELSSSRCIRRTTWEKEGGNPGIWKRAYGTHWCFLVHWNVEEAQVPRVDHILKPFVLDEPSQPLPLGHLLIVLAILSSEQVPSPRARQLCNASPISICQGLQFRRLWKTRLWFLYDRLFSKFL